MPHHRRVLSARVHDEGDRAVIRFAGASLALTHDNAAAFSEAFRPITRWAGRRLVLNFGNVTLVSAAGLGALVRLHKDLRAAGSALVLRGLRAPVYEVFEVTRLTDLLDVEPPPMAPPTSCPERENRS